MQPDLQKEAIGSTLEDLTDLDILIDELKRVIDRMQMMIDLLLQMQVVITSIQEIITSLNESVTTSTFSYGTIYCYTQYSAAKKTVWVQPLIAQCTLSILFIPVDLEGNPRSKDSPRLALTRTKSSYVRSSKERVILEPTFRPIPASELQGTILHVTIKGHQACSEKSGKRTWMKIIHSRMELATPFGALPWENLAEASTHAPSDSMNWWEISTLLRRAMSHILFRHLRRLMPTLSRPSQVALGIAPYCLLRKAALLYLCHPAGYTVVVSGRSIFSSLPRCRFFPSSWRTVTSTTKTLSRFLMVRFESSGGLGEKTRLVADL
ncbi:hypothetical protein J6590_072656 [Homalodisca vitripennis]|nr:hypothetical protein J6590_072656 [Homalodisca vitripennis]